MNRCVGAQLQSADSTELSALPKELLPVLPIVS